MGITSLRRTMIPSMNDGAVGKDVEPAYGTIWRTAMMSSTNVSGPMRKVMRRRSLSATRRFCHAADRRAEMAEGFDHFAGGGAVGVGDGAHLLHGGHDLLAFRGLVGGHLENLMNHFDGALHGGGDHGRAGAL